MAVWPYEPWEHLNAFVQRIKERDPKRKIWTLLKEKPVTIQSIDELARDGWKVIPEAFEWSSGSADAIAKTIWVSEPTAYQRDKTLFHEIAHAYYGEEIADSMNFIPERQIRQENNAIAEWIGRQSRSQPSLLRHAILTFDLKPEVYDMVSYLSFEVYTQKSREYFEETGRFMD